MADDDVKETQGETPGGGDEKSPTFETWLASQDESVQGLLDTHTSGMRSALETERRQRKELARQLKELGTQQEAGSQAQKALEAMSEKLEGYEQQMAAYDALSAAGVGNLRLAYLAARDADAIRRDGTIDLDGLKRQFPELFIKKTPPPGNAGTGANTKTGQTGMNDFIRAAAGRR